MSVIQMYIYIQRKNCATTFTIIYILIYIYMKTRLGLKPEQYSKEERKYDEFKEKEIV